MTQATTTNMRDSFNRWAAGLRPAAALALAVAAVLVLAAIDYATGREISFSIFYIAPVAFVTWYAGAGRGLAVAVLSAVTWGVIDILAGSLYSLPIIPVWNSTVRLGFFALFVILLAKIRAANEKALALALADSLTGLPNARAFYAFLEQEILRLRRHRVPFVLAYIDLDHFKQVNDRLGHAGGDDLLIGVARALTTTVRASDLVARLGGDEFAVIMPEVHGGGALAGLQRIRDTVNASLAAAAARVPEVGATIGAVLYSEAPESADAAVKYADDEMYAGKRSGRGTIRLTRYGAEDAAPPVGERS